MASIRRTLSPAYHDRHYQNGGANSPSQKFAGGISSSKYSPSFSSAIAAFAVNFRRKGPYGLRRSFLRLAVFFLVGFLLGMMPYDRVDDDVRARGFSFGVKPQLQQQAGGVVRREDLIVDVRLGVEEKEAAVRSELREVALVFVPRKQIIVVTPTYGRPAQAYFLHRLGQVLQLVPPPLLWIVVEMNSASMETAELLRKTGVMYRHLVCAKNATEVKDRGVHQRNTALQHIEQHRLDGIVYFADDDNVYSLELFYGLRNISRFGTWPVAMLARSKNKAVLEGPVCNGSQVIGWHTNEKSRRLRRFHVDMSGFAFNSTILWDPKRWRRPFSAPIRQLDTVKEGFQETTFIEQLVGDESQMEGTPEGCSRVLNWHLHLEARGVLFPKGWLLQENLNADIPFSG